MDAIREELLEIPSRALALLEHPSRPLPLHVPYLGMGSSYFAPLAFKYQGLDIYPEIASEYGQYVSRQQKKPLGVILSQSGRSTEALWCRPLFDRYIAVTNSPENSLSTAPNVAERLQMRAGEERFSSSKTYINTLLLLFQGFGLNPAAAVDLLVRKFQEYEEKGRQLAEEVFAIRQHKNIHGMYITGSGPNIATALEAALILSESTKLNFHGLPLAQYDHGPKETAADSIVIQILARGPAYDRSLRLSAKIAAAGAAVLTVEEPEATEPFSILHNIVPFNFMAYYLAQKMNIRDTFTVGGKITEVT
jgi:glucosamine--fructose-6-phosphate aminotransferase (isomerizing)